MVKGTNSNQEIIGIHYQTGAIVSLQVNEGKIDRIVEISDKDLDIEREQLPLIGPGLVDLQINGYLGMDCNTLPITVEMLQRLTKELYREGVTAFYPTVITNSDEVIEEAVRSIAKACKQHSEIDQAVAGIHVEGPFISIEDGARGAHGKQFVKAPDWSLFQRWQEAADGRIKILTLSPEWEGSSEFIRKCTESGVTISIGHTAATPEQIQEAVKAGARMSTHLGNGAHLMLPRHPNYIWEQLAQDGLWSCVIGDGFHLPDSVLKVVIKTKREQAILVSDAVFLAGMKPGPYETHIGGKVVLTEEGKLHLAENPKILAGSAQMLPFGIHKLIHNGIVDLSEAWEMSSIRPSSLMGLSSKSGLEVGAPADFVLFKVHDDRIEVINTYKSGNLVYKI